MFPTSCRIAFVTSEFVSETQCGGGLGNYLYRMTKALRELGHVPEVFVLSKTEPRVLDFAGIRVERVPPSRRLSARLLYRLIKTSRLTKGAPLLGPEGYLIYARALADAFLQRHDEAPFDFVQSTNCWASGLFIRRMKNCSHLVRLSSKRDLWFELDGHTGLGACCISWLERRCVRHADIAYAPSKYLAECCRRGKWRNDVQVVRPAAFLEVNPAKTIPWKLPPRFLVHFGQIGKRKGSFWLASALLKAWETAPDLQMVWVGRTIRKGDFERCHAMWGAFAQNVTWLGAIPKPDLYAVLKRSEAAVLPSLADNLPNTVIESLLLGVPVIGSQGASIDELVEPPSNGTLVPPEDDAALVDALVHAWDGNGPWTKSGFRTSKVLEDLEPLCAAESLLRLASEGKRSVNLALQSVRELLTAYGQPHHC